MVLLDSSALLAPFETGVDFVKGIFELTGGFAKLVVPFETIVELKRLSAGTPKTAGMARLALEVARGIRMLPPTGMACDDALVFLAKTYKSAVATADSVLRRRLRALGIPVFYPAGEGRIMGAGFGEVMRVI
jgi:rRNA-processing protein FCF1